MADAPTKPKRKTRKVPIAQQQREKELVDRYTDPNSPTYLNGTQSVKASPGYNASNDVVAASMAREIISRPQIAQSIRQRLQDNNMGDSVRADITSVIAQGYTETITTTTETEGRPPVVSTVRKPVAARTRLLALDRLDRIDGSADRRRVEADVLSTELRALSKRMLGEKDVSHGVSKSIHSGAGARDRARGEDAPQSPSIPSPPSSPDTNISGGPNE